MNWIEYRIKEVREKQLTELDLSSAHNEPSALEAVPHEVFELTHLKSLDLSRNNIQEIPPQISKLQNLETLNLSVNFSLTKVSDQLSSLRKLKILNFSYSPNVGLPFDIGRLSNLEKLDLDECKRGLPRGLLSLHRLKHLSLDGNHLEHFGKAIGRLASLRSVSVDLETSKNVTNSLKLLGSLDLLSLTIGKIVSVWILPVVILGGLLLVTIIGAFQLRNDSRIEEKNFVTLMKLAFQQIPLLGKLVPKKDSVK